MLHTEIRQGLGPAEQGPQIKRLYEGGCNMCQTSPSVVLLSFGNQVIGCQMRARQMSLAMFFCSICVVENTNQGTPNFSSTWSTLLPEPLVTDLLPLLSHGLISLSWLKAP